MSEKRNRAKAVKLCADERQRVELVLWRGGAIV